MRMRNNIIIYSLLLTIILCSCQERFNGENKQSFDISRNKIEEKLNNVEKDDLEKAMRVISMESMRLKRDKSEKYKVKTFNDVSLELVDGLTFSASINLAEKILRDNNKREIQQLEKDIDSLTIESKNITSTLEQLDVFKIHLLELKNEEWFGEKIPKLYVAYKYTSAKDLKGQTMVEVELIQKSTQKTISKQVWGEGYEESILRQNDILSNKIILKNGAEKIPQLTVIKNTVVNPKLSDFDLELKLNGYRIFKNGEIIQKPKISVNDIMEEIRLKENKLSETKNRKGTLDEYELSHE